jgi:hypothetical protein
MTAAFLFGLIAFAAVVANIAIRDHRRAVAARRALLDDCRGVLDDERWTAGADGFPSLDGRAFGHAVKVALIPDTMVVRRLPQLWLSVTVLDHLPGAPSLSLLARHSGNEFYAVAYDLPERVDPPAGLPLDVLIRGSGARARALCHRLAPTLATLLADPRTKDITLTARGVRIVRQVAEGRRGEHLLLRQAVFDTEHVERALLVETLRDAAGLAAQRTAAIEERAA